MTDRRVLWLQVREISYGVCEWPGCVLPMMEMAHIYPRGMGHHGYRDRIENVMAACGLHARVTDDLSRPDWSEVPYPGDRQALVAAVADLRRSRGWAA